MKNVAGKRGCGRTTKIRETFGRKNDQKRLKTTKNDQKRPQNVFTASLLRPYRLLTDFAIQSDTSNFPPTKVRKTCVKHRTW